MLDDAGAARLGNVLLAVLAAVLAVLIGADFSPLVLLLVAGGLMMTFTTAGDKARPAVTRWLDRLGDPARR